MTEQAKVIKTSGETANVEIQKTDKCSKCGMCVFPKDAKSTTLEVTNTINAKEGDEVIIEHSTKASILGIFLVFVVPLLLIGVSVVLGYLVINVEIWIVILSVIFIVLWYTILAILDKKLKNKMTMRPKIVNIIIEKEKEKTYE